MRVNILLACTECKRRNYATVKNKKNTTGRLEVKKYCPWDKKHTLHRETKQFSQSRSVALTVERRSPKPNAGGSNPS